MKLNEMRNMAYTRSTKYLEKLDHSCGFPHFEIRFRTRRVLFFSKCYCGIKASVALQHASSLKPYTHFYTNIQNLPSH